MINYDNVGDRMRKAIEQIATICAGRPTKGLVTVWRGNQDERQQIHLSHFRSQSLRLFRCQKRRNATIKKGGGCMDTKYYDVIFTLLELLKELKSENNWKDIVISDKEKEIKTLKEQLGIKERGQTNE